MVYYGISYVLFCMTYNVLRYDMLRYHICVLIFHVICHMCLLDVGLIRMYDVNLLYLGVLLIYYDILWHVMICYDTS